DLSRVGGKDSTEVINNIFRKLVSDDVCNKFILYGTATKTSFAKLEVYELIIDCVRSVHATSRLSEAEIKHSIMSWLQHSM
ncbi:unnamed protein product, partial [Allacma fusca]